MPDYTGGQFPSLDGDLETEVAQRTEPATAGLWFRHVFTVHNRAHTVGLDPDHEVHRANFVAVLQRALQQGLHPKSQPVLESEEPCPSDPVNHTNLTYRVKVVPAVADDDPYTTVTPSNPYGDPGLGLTGSDPVYDEEVEDQTQHPEGGGGAGSAVPEPTTPETETAAETVEPSQVGQTPEAAATQHDPEVAGG